MVEIDEVFQPLSWCYIHGRYEVYGVEDVICDKCGHVGDHVLRVEDKKEGDVCKPDRTKGATESRGSIDSA